MTEPEIRIACPTCGSTMVPRHNKTSGGEFLGCSRWPECKETRPVPVYVTLMRQGAPQLPGMKDL